MGKKSGNSWLTAVKRAFRSPTKDSPEKVRNCRRKQDHPSEDHDDDKKKEKRRWLFRKPVASQQEETGGGDVADQRHAIAVAVATAAAAEAAVATAHAAMEVARLARPGSNTKKCNNNVNHKQHSAAVVIQTSFRGYLARRALRALKGLVKLQALVRGHNVRKQAKMTLKCMQALVRVQSRVLDQRMRLSHEGCRFSAFSDTTSILEARYLQDIAERRSLSHSREPSSIADDWDERPHKIEEVKAMFQSRKEAAFKREKSLSQAFSQQMWRSDRSSMGEEEREETPKWLDRWMASKQWDSTIASSPAMRARASIDHHRDSIKTVEMDTSQPYSYFRRSSISSSCTYQPNYHNQRPASPLHSRAHHSQPGLVTPSPVRARPIQVRSASPRCAREDRGYYTSNVSQYSQTPSLRSNYYYNKSGPNNCNGSIPNYMAATESAKARVRSQSAPRQRPTTPERDRPGTAGSGAGPKKRLSFPNPDPYGVGNEGYNLRSPSFKSVIEQQTNYSSCCTDSFGGELSPSSTSDLRRWLR